MPGAHFTVQNYTSSSLGLSAAWVVSHADLLHRNIKGYC